MSAGSQTHESYWIHLETRLGLCCARTSVFSATSRRASCRFSPGCGWQCGHGALVRPSLPCASTPEHSCPPIHAQTLAKSCQRNPSCRLSRALAGGTGLLLPRRQDVAQALPRESAVVPLLKGNAVLFRHAGLNPGALLRHKRCGAAGSSSMKGSCWSCCSWMKSYVVRCHGWRHPRRWCWTLYCALYSCGHGKARIHRPRSFHGRSVPGVPGWKQRRGCQLRGLRQIVPGVQALLLVSDPIPMHVPPARTDHKTRLGRRSPEPGDGLPITGKRRRVRRYSAARQGGMSPRPDCKKAVAATDPGSQNSRQSMRRRSRAKPFVCTREDCGKQFIGPRRLRLHLRTHTGEKPLVCPWEGCASRFGQPESLTAHLRLHSGERPFVCRWEGCGKLFTRSNVLRAHRRIHTGERPFSCPYKGCARRFTQSGSLTVHWQAAHAEKKVFVCPWEACGKRLSSRSGVRMHVSYVHVGKKSEPCPYEDCARQFVRSAGLVVHLRSHTGEKPFACPWEGCDTKFSTMSNVNVHLRRHTGEKPFACSYQGCGKHFAQSSALKIHELRHGREKPLICLCAGCGTKFAQPADMAVHRCHHRVRFACLGSAHKNTGLKPTGTAPYAFTAQTRQVPDPGSAPARCQYGEATGPAEYVRAPGKKGGIGERPAPPPRFAVPGPGYVRARTSLRKSGSCTRWGRTTARLAGEAKAPAMPPGAPQPLPAQGPGVLLPLLRLSQEELQRLGQARACTDSVIRSPQQALAEAMQPLLRRPWESAQVLSRDLWVLPPAENISQPWPRLPARTRAGSHASAMARARAQTVEAR